MKRKLYQILAISLALLLVTTSINLLKADVKADSNEASYTSSSEWSVVKLEDTSNSNHTQAHLAWISVDSGTGEIFFYLAVKSSKEIHAIEIQDPPLQTISLNRLGKKATFSLDGESHAPGEGFNKGQADDAYWIIGQFKIPSDPGVGSSYSYIVTAQGGGHEISGKISVPGGLPPSSEVDYQVEHYLQNITDNDYTMDEGATQTLIGTAGDYTEAAANAYEGFTYQSFSQEEIAADGSTVIEIYYDRIEYTINYLAGVNGSIEGLKEQEVKYGGNTTEVTAVAAQGYRFVKWEEDNNTVATRSETEVKANATYTAIFEVSDDAVYTVKHYKELLAGGYPTTASETETKNGTTGTQTSAMANAYEGFAYQSFSQEEIAADGSTVIEIYYVRIEYTLTYKIDGEFFTEDVHKTQTYKYEASVTEVDKPGQMGYIFVGWENVPDTMPAEDVIATGYYTRNYVAPDPEPAMTVTKVGEYVDVNENDYLNVGDRIDYTITVTNTGDVVLTDIKVVDPLIGLNLKIDELGVGESWKHLGSYDITGDDIDAEKVINTVTVSANELEDPVTAKEETLLDGEVEEVVAGEEEEEEEPKEPTDPEVPVTGEALAWQYPALGALLMTLGAVVLVLRRKELA